MAAKDLTIKCSDATIEAVGGGTYPPNLIKVNLNNVDVSEVLSDFDIDDIVDHYGAEEILKHLGEEKCIEFFGIKTAE